MPALARITIFPIKSLDGVELSESRVLPTGALQNDRRWAIVDEQGRMVNAKRTSAVHAIRARFADDATMVELQHGGQCEQFRLDRQSPACAAWLSRVLGQSCNLVEDAERGHPDDEEAPGPTLISEGSLGAVAQWFSIRAVENARRRLRANLEIAPCEPFWEDRLVGDLGQFKRFSIGGAVFEGRRICQRCVVPSRDPDSGETIAGFAKRFAKLRQESLAADAAVRQFDHFYRVAINTSVVSLQDSNMIRVGDELRIHP